MHRKRTLNAHFRLLCQRKAALFDACLTLRGGGGLCDCCGGSGLRFADCCLRLVPPHQLHPRVLLQVIVRCAGRRTKQIARLPDLVALSPASIRPKPTTLQ